MGEMKFNKALLSKKYSTALKINRRAERGFSTTNKL